MIKEFKACWSCGGYTGRRVYWLLTWGGDKPCCGKCKRETTLRYCPVVRVERLRG